MRTALVRTIDAQWVERLRKDFLTLMKNVPRVTDYAEADRLRNAFKIYRANFHLWVFEEFLNVLKGREDASFEGLRKPAWDFYGELDFPLGRPDSKYDDAYNKPEVLFGQFEGKRDAWATRLKRKAQVCWKAFNDYLNWRTEKKVDMALPDEDQLVLEGFQVKIVGWDPQEASWQTDAFERFKESLRLYRRRAKAALPWLLQKQLPLTLTFKGSIDEGGRYHNGSHISVSMSAMINEPPEWGAHILAHEMGHHLFKSLDNAASTYWHAVIRQDYEPTLDLRALLAQWPQSIRWTDDFAKTLRDNDPILSVQLDVLSRERGGNAGWEDRDRFQRALDEGETTVYVPKHPITGYAGKNPEEAFCEAIGRLVGYGPRTVLPIVLGWLEVTIPGMVRTAARVAARYLARRSEHLLAS